MGMTKTVLDLDCEQEGLMADEIGLLKKESGEQGG